MSIDELFEQGEQNSRRVSSEELADQIKALVKSDNHIEVSKNKEDYERLRVTRLGVSFLGVNLYFERDGEQEDFEFYDRMAPKSSRFRVDKQKMLYVGTNNDSYLFKTKDTGRKPPAELTFD